MEPVRTKTFRSGNSEAIRLPKGYGFGDDIEVELERVGDVLTVRAVRMSPAELVRRLNELPSPDYVETRDTDEIPEPTGL